ncbi:MAG: DsbA family protein [Myxococcota bacterium]
MSAAYPHGRRGGPRGRTSLGLAVLLVSTFTQCVCQNTRDAEAPRPEAEPRKVTAGEPSEAKPGEPKGPSLPGGLDTKDLDEAERDILAAVLEQQFDPCGEPRSFLESLEADDTCGRAWEMGDYTVGLVQKGLSKRQIVRALLQEMARTSVEAEFTLEGSPYLGDPAAEHVLVEYLDFQCPACRVAAADVKRIVEGRDDVVLYVKHLPLEGHHPQAKLAARASLAADRQGRFWKLHRLLFDAQARLTPEVVRELAKEAGLDMERFEEDLESEAVAAIVERDVAEADRAGVDGTPTFFLDGRMVELERLEEALERADND